VLGGENGQHLGQSRAGGGQERPWEREGESRKVQVAVFRAAFRMLSFFTLSFEKENFSPEGWAYRGRGGCA
jgi:hypothetical protein